MLLDWLGREGWVILSWWALVSLAGAAALPLCMRLMGGLPDRGYTLARAAGVLLTAFVYWLLVSFGLLQNSTGSIVSAWLVFLALSLTIYFRTGTPVNLRAWWQENKRVVIITEILFIVLLVGWTIVRAYQNDTVSTEKPMDLMFLSGIMRSDTFPPNDAWLSGYAISYYHFGYIISAMLTMMSGVNNGIGFSMTNALLFALTSLGAFGVMYNMVRARTRNTENVGFEPKESLNPYRAPLLTGILALIFVTLLGNFQLGLIELPYQGHALSADYYNFWGTQEFKETLSADVFDQFASNSVLSDPATWDYWWWFRASRVLTDYNLDGKPGGTQPIDEFPQFSFLLADNHPHVMALPYVILAIGLALNLLLQRRDLKWFEILIYGVAFGSLMFLNTWDWPMYLALLLGADALRRILNNETRRLHFSDIWGLVQLGVFMIAIGIVAYLPFIIGFRSQAGGFLPNLLFPTQFQRYFIMFGPFILILAFFLITEVWRGSRERLMNWRFGGLVAGGFFIFLLLLLAVFMLLSSISPSLRTTVEGFVSQNGGWDAVSAGLMSRRLNYGLTIVVLLVAILLVVGRLFPRKSTATQGETLRLPYPAVTGFALLLVAMGAALSLVPEFIYLRDNFGARINTIFKFYYQVWMVFAFASAYGVYTILSDIRLAKPAFPVRVVFAIVAGGCLVLGGLYPLLGIPERMLYENLRSAGRGRAALYSALPEWESPQTMVSDWQFVRAGDIVMQDNALIATIGEDAVIRAVEDGQVRFWNNNVYIVPALSLDGRRYMVSADDYAVVMWLSEHVDGDNAVVAEAVRDAYNSRYGRVGSMTGIPILLGWDGHEGQWRGPTYGETVGTRRQDIENLYTDLRWDVALNIIKRYDIDYIMYGETERNQYGLVGEEKFAEYLEVAYESGTSRVYYVGKDVQSESEMSLP